MLMIFWDPSYGKNQPAVYLSKCFLKAENSMMGRAYMGSAEREIFWGSCKFLQAHKKVCNENETKERKSDARVKMLFMEA